jgi:small-conductance mechanosensitive channel
VELLARTYYGNQVRGYLFAAGVALAVLVGAVVARLLLARKLGALAARTQTRVDDLVVDVIQHTRTWVVLVVAIYLGATSLTLPPHLGRGIQIAAVVALLVQIGLWSGGVIRFLAGNYRARKEREGDTGTLGTVQLLALVARAVVWAMVLLLILENLGVNVTALVAGLGIGGIAVALAIQNILSDLFASVSIMLDKPFAVGDLITVGPESGRVQSIGIKTTRLRSLSGEELVFANNDLLQSRIRNFERMTERRVLFTVGVTYQTPAAQVEELPALLRGLVEATPGVRFDRAHFKAFGDSALLYEVVYFVTTADYPGFMDAQQRINFAIVRAFEERGISMAYPTQTVFLQRPPS